MGSPGFLHICSMDWNRLPKVELHLHLDCSLSHDVVKAIDPSVSYEAYRDSFIAPPKCTDLVDYISRAVKGFELMQTPEQLRLVTLDLFQQLKRDNNIYAEIRFAPLLHIAKGMKPEAVVRTVNDAVTEGIAATGVEAGLILCTLRHYNEEQSMTTVKLVEAFQGTNVVAFDIAGDEAGFPVDAHKKAFAYAREKGLHVIAHGGEARGADSVREVLGNFHPSRIGHGVRSVEDPALLDLLKASDIHLEVCPTSNVQVNVVDTIADHPVDYLYRKELSISINTDCRTISDCTLTSEYRLLENTFQWTLAHFYRCNCEAVRHSFARPELKARLLQQLDTAYNQGNPAV